MQDSLSLPVPTNLDCNKLPPVERGDSQAVAEWIILANKDHEDCRAKMDGAASYIDAVQNR